MTTIASVKRTKMYKALIAVGLDENAALKELGHVVAAPVDERLARLIAAGFTEAKAREALANAGVALDAAPQTVAATTVAKPLIAKDAADALVAESPYEFTKGRVYVGGDAIEAQVRVRKTGKPEIVGKDGEGRTKALLMFKTANGDVAIQNLMLPEASA